MSHKKNLKKTSRDERREKRNRKIMSWVLVFLMVVSMAGIFMSGQSSGKNLKFNDYSFEVFQEPTSGNYFYKLKKDDSGKYFYYLPQDVLSISTKGNISKILFPADFFVLSTEEKSPFASYFDQFRYEMNTFTGKRSIGATFNKSSEEMMILTCANSSIEVPVIEWRISNETKMTINQTNGCIKVDSRREDFALARDRLFYSLLGVIKN